jgi:hypothetical protein
MLAGIHFSTLAYFVVSVPTNPYRMISIILSIVLKIFETWSLALRKNTDYRLRIKC